MYLGHGKSTAWVSSLQRGSVWKWLERGRKNTDFGGITHREMHRVPWCGFNRYRLKGKKELMSCKNFSNFILITVSRRRLCDWKKDTPSYRWGSISSRNWCTEGHFKTWRYMDESLFKMVVFWRNTASKFTRILGSSLPETTSFCAPK